MNDYSKLKNILLEIKTASDYGILIKKLSYSERANLLIDYGFQIRRLLNECQVDEIVFFKNILSPEEATIFIEEHFKDAHPLFKEIFCKYYVKSFTQASKIVAMDGKYLKYLLDYQDNQEIVELAVRNYGSSIQYASLRLQKTVALCILAINQNRFAVNDFLPEMLDNFDIIWLLLQKNVDGLSYASPRLCDDKTLVMEAVNHLSTSFKLVSERLRNDIDVVRLALKIDYRRIQYVGSSLLNNPEVLNLAFEGLLQTMKNLNLKQKDNLRKIFKRFSPGLFNEHPLDTLKQFQSDKIIKLASLSSSDLDSFLQLFDYNTTIKLDDRTIDNVLEAVIQREFKHNNRELFTLFTTLNKLLKTGQHQQVIEKIVILSKQFDFSSIFSNYHITLEQFLFDLVNGMQNNSKTILHEICNFVIEQSRNKYLKERQKTIKKETNLIKKYDKRYLLQKLFQLPDEQILQLLDSLNDVALDLKLEEFLNDKDLIRKCIQKQKNPHLVFENFNNNNLYLFNRLLDKLYLLSRLDFLALEQDAEVYYQPSEVSNEDLFHIINNLDYDNFIDVILNNHELYQELLKILRNFKLLGWANNFTPLFQKNSMEIDRSTWIAFFNYFCRRYPILLQEVSSGHLQKINLTRLLEEALLCGSSPSKIKYLIAEEDYNLICLDPQLNSSLYTKTERLDQVPVIIKKLYERRFLTVPPLDMNIPCGNNQLHVQIGNFTNSINLTLGERTSSCMRIGGVGYSLFEFCNFDENGFHIIFTNPQTGQFVSRASCFRNGNSVFINQLSFSNNQKNYRDLDLKDALRLVAQQIIEQTSNSQYPIENVFVSNDLVFSLGNEATIDIGEINLQAGLKEFKIDISPRTIICLNPSSVKKVALSPTAVEHYPVARGKIQTINEPSLIAKQIQKIHLINELLKNTDFVLTSTVELDISSITTLYSGDDWYIAFDQNDNIISAFIVEDEYRREIAIDEITQFFQAKGFTQLPEIVKKTK